MNTIGHPASLMGDDLRREVERQLLLDLAHYRSSGLDSALVLDWSNPCQEGHQASCFGGTIESMSDVSVVDSLGDLVAEGWIDFVHGPDGLTVFWLFLDLIENGSRTKVKASPEIPARVWQLLSPDAKKACSSDPNWRRDRSVDA
jgi:hypothetical protein